MDNEMFSLLCCHYVLSQEGATMELADPLIILNPTANRGKIDQYRATH
jgi:hypothetical protein